MRASFIISDISIELYIDNEFVKKVDYNLDILDSLLNIIGGLDSKVSEIYADLENCNSYTARRIVYSILNTTAYVLKIEFSDYIKQSTGQPHSTFTPIKPTYSNDKFANY